MDQQTTSSRVLVVDDEPFALKLIARQLEQLGYSDLRTHEQAPAALAELKADPDAVQLVFCDLQMPTMDGVEFVRNLGSLGYAGGLVLVSGEDTRILQTALRLAQAHRLRVLGALHKPTSPEQLREVLRSRPQAPAVARAHSEAYSPEDLWRAINFNELINHYQPKVSLASGEPVGVETLVRWRHPKDGLVFPDRFIGTAEQNGLIDELTRVVLKDALDQHRAWTKAGLEIHLAVNVSMDSLGDVAFVDRLTDQLGDSGVPPSALVLEVTESRLMQNPLASLDILTRLRLRHVGLSIDDFGTGHSSLAQLRDIPFNELKIDRGFVDGASQEPSLRTIVESNLGMARQLGMTTVAEGVERREDWDLLRAAGCDLAQGYFIGRPMPGDDLLRWLESWERRRTELNDSPGP